MRTIPDPREAIRSCLAVTRHTVGDLANAAAISRSRLQSALSCLVHLTPDEIERCNATLRGWLTEERGLDAAPGGRP